MLEETFKRALRAVFGGGANIDAANPLQVDTLENLMINDDGRSYFSPQSELDRSYNDFFFGRSEADATKRADIDEYWDREARTIAGGRGGIWSIYSRRKHNYGLFVVEAQLATKCSTLQYIGFENGSGTWGGIWSFYLNDTKLRVIPATPGNLEFYAGGRAFLLRRR